MSFEGKVAVVTGGAMGIGQKVVEILHSRGASVVIADRDLAAADALATRLGDRAQAVVVDVSKEEDIARAAQFCYDGFGRVDVLVNNAAGRVKGRIPDMSLESWQQIVAVNLIGVGLMCKHIIPMMTSGDSAIVNVSSANAIGGRTGMAQYDATKAGVLALSRDLACDHADEGIRVNTVLPGPTLTPFHYQLAERQGRTIDESVTKPHEGGPGILRRRGRPEEIAQAIVFLASEEASYITGTQLCVDGGLTAMADGRPASAR